MSLSKPSGTATTPLAQDLWRAARYYLGRRRVLLGLGAVALVAGLAFNWSALAAAGIVPLLLSLAPCAAMCALGLCMHRTGGSRSSKEPAAEDSASQALQPEILATAAPGPNGLALGLDGPAALLQLTAEGRHLTEARTHAEDAGVGRDRDSRARADRDLVPTASPEGKQCCPARSDAG